MKLIDRNEYMEQLKRVKDILDIKVITGVRRCGKPKLMDAYGSFLVVMRIEPSV